MTESTDLVAQGLNGGLAAFMEENDAFAGMANEYNVQGDVLQFSGNTGAFTYKGKPFEHGTQVIMNVFESQKGWICWKNKKPIDKAIVKVVSRQPVLPKDQLPDHRPYEKEGEGWFEYIVIPVADIEGEHPQMELGLSSISGVSALARLIAEYGQKSRMHLDEKGRRKMPIVELGATSFESKKAIGKKWAPQFKIVDWISIDEMDAARANAPAANEKEEEEATAAPAQEIIPPAQQAPLQGFQQNRAGKRV